MELNRLSVPDHIQFKLAVFVFRCLHGTALPYLAEQLQLVAAWSHAEGYDPWPRPDWTSRGHDRLRPCILCHLSSRVEQFVVIDAECTFVVCI